MTTGAATVNRVDEAAFVTYKTMILLLETLCNKNMLKEQEGIYNPSLRE